jgi:hypothetical protein
MCQLVLTSPDSAVFFFPNLAMLYYAEIEIFHFLHYQINNILQKINARILFEMGDVVTWWNSIALTREVSQSVHFDFDQTSIISTW